MPGHALFEDCAASHTVKGGAVGEGFPLCPTAAKGERLAPWGQRVSLSISSERICLANHMLLAGANQVLKAALISVHSPPKLWCQRC